MLLHVRQLDGIRAIAVLIVLAAHAGLEKFIPGGFGVTIFFFLSGYLITTLMRAEVQQTGTLCIRDFYIRRICRINPPLWITLAVAACLAASGLIPCRIDLGVLAAQFFFTVNYLAQHTRANCIPALWSLAVEEHFYLIFPLAYLHLLSGQPARRAALWVFGAAAAILAVRCIAVLVLSDFSGIYRWSHTRIDSILFGCCLALWQNPVLDRGNCYRPAPLQIWAACAVLLACLVIRNEVFRQTLRYTLQGGALFVLFSAVLQDSGRVTAFLSCRPLRAIGLLSYTIYLSHELAFSVMAQHGALPPSLQSVAALLVTALYAALMFWVVERPLGAVRRRLHAQTRHRKVHPAFAMTENAPPVAP